MRIFVSRALPLDVREVVPASIAVDVSPHDRPLTAAEITSMARGAEAIVSMLYDPFDAPLMDRLPGLKVLANYAVGYDNVDLAAAAARGIVVTNTPDVLTDATADLTLALILAVARRLREGERLLRTQGFRGVAPGLLLGVELRGKTLGIFGMGRIGQAVARLAAAFGMNVLYTSRSAVPGFERVEWPELLARADVLTLHAPANAATRHLLDDAAFAAMKRGALVINAARGILIDEAALVRALESGRLRGAGLDVFEHEPAVHPGLASRDDVVLLPHLGSATVETRQAMARIALTNCVEVLAGRPARTPVRQ